MFEIEPEPMTEDPFDYIHEKNIELLSKKKLWTNQNFYHKMK